VPGFTPATSVPAPTATLGMPASGRSGSTHRQAA
jgi:hypothetical protein